MGMWTNSTGGGTGRRRRQSYVPMAEINVTPFVDVMLVLLIVFMVAAPLLTVGVPVELPETKAKPLPSDKDPLAITVKAGGSVLLQETEIDLDNLVPKLVEISKSNKRGADLRQRRSPGRVRHDCEGHGADQLRRVHQGGPRYRLRRRHLGPADRYGCGVGLTRLVQCRVVRRKDMPGIFDDERRGAEPIRSNESVVRIDALAGGRMSHANAIPIPVHRL